MAAPTKISIPSLDEMESSPQLETATGTLFKRHKDIKNCPSFANSDVNQCTNKEESQKSTSSTLFNTESSNQQSSSIQGVTEKTEEGKSSVPSKPGSSNYLVVNPRQRGNPILKSVRSIPWEYGNIVPDYVMGPSNCALFLSLRYHQLHPNYIHDRLKSLGKSYELRVMLVQVDVKEPHHLLKDLAKICLLADCTLILAFSTEEAGRYLETYKVFENKPAEAIMERTEDNYMAKFVDCLTRVKSVNKTDCATLVSAFGSLANVMEAKEDELCLCPGFGPQKAKRLHSIFQEPFLRSQSQGTSSQDKNFGREGT